VDWHRKNYCVVNLVGKRTALTSAQKIPEFEINDRIVLQPHTWYTCPAGKKAIVKGSVQCTGRGAAANADFNVAGVLLFSWVTAGGVVQDYIDGPRNLSVVNGGQQAFFKVELSAGDIIETTQNAGTNAEFNVFASVQETDA